MVKRSEAFPSRWMSAADLNGKPDVATIKVVAQETIQGSQKLVVYVTSKYKPLILNKTNFDSIAAIANSGETNDWPKTKIEYYPSTVPYNGEIRDCVRIRRPGTATKPKSKKSDDPKPDFDDEVKF
jgi:hypothetical protein